VFYRASRRDAPPPYNWNLIHATSRIAVQGEAVTPVDPRHQDISVAMALFAGCALVTLVTGTLIGAHGARLGGGMRIIAIVGISGLTARVVRRIWARRHVSPPPVAPGRAAKAAAFRGMVGVLLGYVVLMAAMGAFLGVYSPALGVSRPILTGFATVMGSLIFLPQILTRVAVWRRSRG
jgi:hypothetical protein